MKVFKSGLCLALTLSIVLGMTGCSAGGFSHKTLCNIAEGNDFDKCKKAMDFSDKRYNYAEEKQFYINAKDEDALPIFYTQIDNSRNSLDHDNISEVTCLYDYTAPIITDDQEDLSYAEAFGTYSVIVLVSYDDKDDAKGFFEEEIEALNLDDEDVAKSKGISVHTHVIGVAYSAGSILAAYGDHRTMSRYSDHLLHLGCAGAL